MTSSVQFDKGVEIAVLKRKNERLRAAIKAAPHDWFKCAISGHRLPKGDQCNCWKSKALKGTK